METVFKQIPDKKESSPVSGKIDEVLKIVNDYRDKILKSEGLSTEQWNKEPGGLWRPDARGIAANAILNPNGHYPGEELEMGLKDLIAELGKNPGYESLAKAAPSIFNYTEGGDVADSWAQAFTYNTLSWSLIYLDGLEANLNMIKASL